MTTTDRRAMSYNTSIKWCGKPRAESWSNWTQGLDLKCALAR